jgi:hypothetical protein
VRGYCLRSSIKKNFKDLVLCIGCLIVILKFLHYAFNILSAPVVQLTPFTPLMADLEFGFSLGDALLAGATLKAGTAMLGRHDSVANIRLRVPRQWLEF